MRKGNFRFLVVLVVMISLIAAGCGVFKGGQKGCGCPNNKGMVGY